jgi:hypothetical protein
VPCVVTGVPLQLRTKTAIKTPRARQLKLMAKILFLICRPPYLINNV